MNQCATHVKIMCQMAWIMSVHCQRAMVGDHVERDCDLDLQVSGNHFVVPTNIVKVSEHGSITR